MADVELKISAETKEALNSIQSFSTGAIGALKGFAVAAAAYLGSRAIINSLDTFIAAASESEEAINNLNISMASAGTYSDKASQGLQAFAAEMQRTTGISDELVINQIAIARNFTKTNEEAQKLTQAAIQLSAATGRDLNSSIEALGKSVQGVGGGLSKTLPAIKGFTEAQLKAGAAVDFVLQRFSGVAEAKMLTFGGAITRTKNAFNDLEETLGDLIIKNPIVIAAINKMGDLFLKFGEILAANKGRMAEFITAGLKGIVSIIPAVVKSINNIVKAFGYMSLGAVGVAEAIFTMLEALSEMKVIRILINAATDAFLIMGATAGKAIGGLLQLIAKIPGATSAFAAMGVNINDVNNQIIDLVTEMESLKYQDGMDSITTSFKEMKESAQASSETIATGLDAASVIMDQFESATVSTTDEILKLGSVSENTSAKVAKRLSDQAKNTRNLTEEIKGFANEIENAFKNPFNLAIKIVVDKQKQLNTEIGKAITQAQKFIADHPLEIELGASAAGLLNAIFKSGAQGSALLEKELTSAIDGAVAQLDSAIKEINTQRDEAILQIEGDFTNSIADLQTQLADGSLTQVQFQEKINALEKQRADDIKKENKKAADKIQDERIKNEKEIAKIREDHAKKLQDLQEKNVQAAAGVAGQFANALGSAMGLPPIFGDIINMLAAPPEVWQGIIDGLVQGIPVVIQRIIENIPNIIAALSQAMPALVDALTNLLVDEKFWGKIVSAWANAIAKKVEEPFKIVGVLIDNIGRNFVATIANGASGFVISIVEGAKKFVDEILKSITGGVKSGASSLQNIATGSGNVSPGAAAVLGPLTPVAGVVGGALGVKFAKGGYVPDGFPNDTFPARLTSGELVIPPGDVQRLSAFLDQQTNPPSNQDLITQLKQVLGSTGGQQQININLQVGEKELASVLLDLNRRGFRTA